MSAPRGGVAKKRLLLALLAAGLALAAGVAGFAWYVITSGKAYLGWLVNLLFVGLFAVALPLLGLGLFLLALALSRPRLVPQALGLIRNTIHVLFPLALFVGRLLRIDKARIEGSFVEINNVLVRARRQRAPSGRILLLLPHCLQRAECAYKITADPDNCRRCGQCRIASLLELRDRRGIAVSVAAGGAQARQAVARLRPRAIVAVACERELASGIQDVGGLPVIGIANLRPHGPCYNTEVDVEGVENTIAHLISGGEA